MSLSATYTPPGGDAVTTTVTREITFNVLNANGAPQFDPADKLLEQLALRRSGRDAENR